jgi:Ribosomal protein L9, N-terminal domain
MLLLSNIASRRAVPARRLSAAFCESYRLAHTIRVIVTGDVASNGKLYKDDIAEVAAGYARNYLIPQRLAVYATRQNFAKYQLKDPTLETAEERQQRLAREAEAGDDQDLKSADLLRLYLRNKVVRKLQHFVLTFSFETNVPFSCVRPLSCAMYVS